MISVTAAKEIISAQIVPLTPLTLPLADAAGLTLAADVYASTDIPGYEQSSMDGYAIVFANKNASLKVTGEMPAGTNALINIGQQEAVRIFTGAPLPAGADTVVMQEKVSIDKGILTVLDDQLQQGSNVRRKGAEVTAGALAIQQGSFLSPAAIGFLAGIGQTEVAVYPTPSISIIVTGNELQDPGQPLGFGQVYQSNSYMLQAALRTAGITNVQVIKAADDKNTLQQILAAALQQSDVVLLTGGVSVGDYDFVVSAATGCGVQQHFHKVKQKPGKPLYFGTLGNKLVFGLPGNPASVLSCFYQYVLPALEALSLKPASVQTIRTPLAAAYTKNAGLTHFLKGNYKDGLAWPLGAQESFRLSTFAQANCLICLDEDRTTYQAGDEVTVYLLPF